MPHVIRLRGPWRIQPLARAVEDDGGSRLVPFSAPEETATVPADWGAIVGADFRGLVRYTRRFQRPTGLSAHSRVWLVIENVDFQARVLLNDVLLGVAQVAGTEVVNFSWSSELAAQMCPVRWDITRLLQPRNELSVQVYFPPDLAIDNVRHSRTDEPGGLIGLVRLEIEEAAG